MDFIQSILHNCFIKAIDYNDEVYTKGNITLVKIGLYSFEFIFNEDNIEVIYKHRETKEVYTYKNIKSFIEGFNQISRKFNYNSHVGIVLWNVSMNLILGKD